MYKSQFKLSTNVFRVVTATGSHISSLGYFQALLAYQAVSEARHHNGPRPGGPTTTRAFQVVAKEVRLAANAE